ncbi:restriction endonuclease subunit S, partial [Campylobacter helveticus]|nr:restriction endonuclease subunit S [Campylobacter helveticus]
MRVYKPSGIEWLGEIPQSWEIKPLQAIFNQRNEQNNNLEFQTILSLVKDVGVIPYEEKGNVGNKAKDDLQNYKIARVNDLVLNKMNAVIGSLGVSKYDGLVSPIYLVLYIENPNYLIAYYSYLFQTKSIQKFLRKFAYGIMEIRESI